VSLDVTGLLMLAAIPLAGIAAAIFLVYALARRRR